MADAPSKYVTESGFPLHDEMSGAPVDCEEPVRTVSAYTIWPPEDGTTLHTLRAEHAKLTKAYRASATHENMSAFFANVLLKQETLKISSCLCLGLGSISSGVHCTSALKKDNVSLAQLVAFESWIEILRTKHSIEKVYFQDPIYNALDIEFLQLRGHTVIEAPASDGYISESTFLFTPCGPSYTIMSTIDLSYPALFIGSDLMEMCTWRAFREDGYGIDEIIADWKKFRQSSPGGPDRPLERAMVLSFLNQRVSKPMPSSDYFWMARELIYYRPDDDSDLVPVVFDMKDIRLYQKKFVQARQALEQDWQAKIDSKA